MQEQLTTTESVVAAIWAQELSDAQVAPDSNFFAIGGDSLVALNVLFLVGERFGLEMHPGSLVQHPTLREFCLKLDQERIPREGGATAQG